MTLKSIKKIKPVKKIEPKKKMNMLQVIEMLDSKEKRRKHPKVHYKKYMCENCGTVWFAKYYRCPCCEYEMHQRIALTGSAKSLAA